MWNSKLKSQSTFTIVLILQLLLGIVTGEERDPMKEPGRCILHSRRQTRRERVEPVGDDHLIRWWVKNFIRMNLTSFDVKIDETEGNPRFIETDPLWQLCNELEWDPTTESLKDDTLKTFNSCNITITDGRVPGSIFANPYGFYGSKSDEPTDGGYTSLDARGSGVFNWDMGTDSVIFSVGDLVWDIKDDAVLYDRNNSVYCIVENWKDGSDAKNKDGKLMYQSTEERNYQDVYVGVPSSIEILGFCFTS